MTALFPWFRPASPASRHAAQTAEYERMFGQPQPRPDTPDDVEPAEPQRFRLFPAGELGGGPADRLVPMPRYGLRYWLGVASLIFMADVMARLVAKHAAMIAEWAVL